MAMTLRLSDAQTAALREQAESEGVSMQSVALRAVDQYLEKNARRIDIAHVLDVELDRYADAIERLGR
ncbi:MAG TPA: CopG family transcriptional regulator [Marmoricola sp.]